VLPLQRYTQSGTPTRPNGVLLRIQLQNHGDVILGPGELFVVPRGVRHCPAADQETRVVLLEPRDTVNTGDANRVGTAGERLT
jgi:mannose-6-phosphate isomerase-like protein (cupin superfamily)